MTDREIGAAIHAAQEAQAQAERHGDGFLTAFHHQRNLVLRARYQRRTGFLPPGFTAAGCPVFSK